MWFEEGLSNHSSPLAKIFYWLFTKWLCANKPDGFGKGLNKVIFIKVFSWQKAGPKSTTTLKWGVSMETESKNSVSGWKKISQTIRKGHTSDDHWPENFRWPTQGLDKCGGKMCEERVVWQVSFSANSSVEEMAQLLIPNSISSRAYLFRDSVVNMNNY